MLYKVRAHRLTINAVPVEYAVLHEIGSYKLTIDPLVKEDIEQFLKADYTIMRVNKLTSV